MLVRFTLAAALLALATACTSPTAPVASSNTVHGSMSGGGVMPGSGGHSSTTTPDDGVMPGSGG